MLLDTKFKNPLHIDIVVILYRKINSSLTLRDTYACQRLLGDFLAILRSGKE